MTNYIDSAGSSISNFSIGNHNVRDVKYDLWIPFVASKNPGQYMPICALNNTDARA